MTTSIHAFSARSGSGKSVLLKALAKDTSDNSELGGVFIIADVSLDQDRPLRDTIGKSVEEGLELLSRVGLNDAFLFVHGSVSSARAAIPAKFQDKVEPFLDKDLKVEAKRKGNTFIIEAKHVEKPL